MKWISVEDGLPTKDENELCHINKHVLLIYHEAGVIHYGNLYETEWDRTRYMECEDSYCPPAIKKSKITHWLIVKEPHE